MSSVVSNAWKKRPRYWVMRDRPVESMGENGERRASKVEADADSKTLDKSLDGH